MLLSYIINLLNYDLFYYGFNVEVEQIGGVDGIGGWDVLIDKTYVYFLIIILFITISISSIMYIYIK